MTLSLIEKPILVFLLFLLLGLFLYSPNLSAPFKTRDDLVSIVHNPSLRSLKSLPDYFTQSYFHEGRYYRPLVMVSYTLDYALAGLNSLMYNLHNIVLHALNAFLLFLIFNLIFQYSRLAFWGALLFLIHPLQWEAVTLISGRSILLCGFFQLLTLLTLMLGLKSKDHRWLLGLSCVSYALALMCKESAVCFIGVIMIFFYLAHQQWKGSTFKNLFKIALSYMFILGGYFYLRHFFHFTAVYTAPSWEQQLIAVITFIKGLWIYFRLIVLPVDLHFDRSLPLMFNWLQPQMILLLGVSMLGLMFFLMQIIRRKLPLIILFFAAWIFCELFPVSQLVAGVGIQPGVISLAEHFFYLPLAGCAGLILYAAQERFVNDEEEELLGLARRQRLLQVLTLITIALIFGTITHEMSAHAASERKLFERTLKYAPYNLRIKESYAFILVQEKKFVEAEDLFRDVLAAQPQNTLVYLSLARCLKDQGRLHEALTMFLNVTDPGPWKEYLDKNIREIQNQIENPEMPDSFSD